jgi:hypothetical protein
MRFTEEYGNNAKVEARKRNSIHPSTTEPGSKAATEFTLNKKEAI